MMIFLYIINAQSDLQPSAFLKLCLMGVNCSWRIIGAQSVKEGSWAVQIQKGRQGLEEGRWQDDSVMAARLGKQLTWRLTAEVDMF